VLQACHRLGLNAETRQLLQSGMSARQNHLESYNAFEGLVPRPVDNTHATLAVHALDLVARHRNQGGSTVRLSVPGLRSRTQQSGGRATVNGWQAWLVSDRTVRPSWRLTRLVTVLAAHKLAQEKTGAHVDVHRSGS
jgi:hypothetical protein